MGLIDTRTPDWVNRAAPWLGRLTIVNLVANVAIIVTGGAVRLTGSGLGCPTWPRCTDASYIPHPALGIHGAIEFGNRMLTFVLVAIVVACWLAALGHRAATSDGRPATLASIVALGVPAQAVIGGISVRTDLNPWVVALHLLVSLGMVACCVLLVVSVRPALRGAARSRTYGLTVVTYVVTWVVLYLGTAVTGAGPHAGDQKAPRNGLDPELASHVHAGAVYALLALTIGVLALSWLRADVGVARWAGWLLAAEAVQAGIGILQVRTGLPEGLVGLHLLGAAVVTSAATLLVVAARGTGVGRRDDGA